MVQQELLSGKGWLCSWVLWEQLDPNFTPHLLPPPAVFAKGDSAVSRADQSVSIMWLRQFEHLQL